MQLCDISSLYKVNTQKRCAILLLYLWFSFQTETCLNTFWFKNNVYTLETCYNEILRKTSMFPLL